MKSKHTPGPWIAVEDENYKSPVDFPGVEQRRFCIDQAPDPGANSWSGRNIGRAFIGETYNLNAEANARLIAAAPEMLEALEDIVEQFKATHFTVGADLADAIRVFGKAAIAKAKAE